MMMISTHFSLLLLVVLALISGISKNMTVCYATLFLIVARLTPLSHLFPWLEKHGLNLGVVVLTIAVLTPIASNKISVQYFIAAFSSWKMLWTVAVGGLVSWLGMRGVAVISDDPGIIMGLIVGTLIGVATFGGLPAGPLIAAGILSLFIGKM